MYHIPNPPPSTLKLLTWSIHQLGKKIYALSLSPSSSRLRTLMQSEEEQYMTEMAGQQETVLERQAKMRERAKMLRERREAERLALVEKKLDQRWR